MLRSMVKGVIRRTGAAFAAVTSAVVVIGAAVPAQAASTPGWRQVHSQHYGPVNDYSAYDVVVASAESSAWALGGSDIAGGTGTVQHPVVIHWNGKAWGAVTLPSGLTSNIIAASAPAANDIWAVTWFGGWVLHWNGSKWLVAKDLPGGGGELTGIVATSPTNVWVFGGGGYIGGLGTWHYDGKTWRAWKNGAALGLENGSALSAKNIWAVGGTLNPYSAIDHFNGTAWHAQAARALSGLQFRDIRAFGAKDVWATAVAFGSTKSTPYLLHYNGIAWTRLSVPWPVQLDQPVSDGHGGLWFTGLALGGQQRYLVHRAANGKWTRTPVTWFPEGLALLPGTSSVLAAGWTYARTGGNAVVWAYGKI